MCGIVGIKKINGSPSAGDEMRVKNALSTQHHRGPDYSGQITSGNVVFGHNRLAIIDTKERSNQPFLDSTGRYILIFNGEIYNYQELKNALLKKGVVFQTSSDTEVLLYHLIEHGEKGIQDLNGCFAFAFYDTIEDELLLARDRMGINPVLFAMQDDQLLFASELSAFQWLMDDFSINRDALKSYFRFTYVPAPYTMFNEVQKLLPGHYIRLKNSSFDIVNYCENRSVKLESHDYDELTKELRSKVERAVISRLNADVPLGTFLSGGIDSSIVSAIAADFKSELMTFSVGFEEDEFYDESKYAKMVADHIGSRHHAITLSNDYIQDELPSILDTFDEPFADSSAIAMYFLSQKASQHLTVCLSGDGPDELFAGYNKHTAFLKSKKPGILLSVAMRLVGANGDYGRSSWFANKVRQLKKFKKLVQLEWPKNYWFLASFTPAEILDSILEEGDENLPKFQQKESLNAFLKMDQRFVLPNDMLKKVDLMSMANSLEVRVPFLDKEVVEFANALPESMKHDGVSTKKIVRDAFADLLPSSVFSRSKKGFEVPLTKWILEGWSLITKEEWFEKEYIREQGLFKPNGIDRLRNQLHSNKPGESAIQIWAYIVFQNWYSRWSEKLK